MKCAVLPCEEKKAARGLCMGHYARWKKAHGGMWAVLPGAGEWPDWMLALVVKRRPKVVPGDGQVEVASGPSLPDPSRDEGSAEPAPQSAPGLRRRRKAAGSPPAAGPGAALTYLPDDLAGRLWAEVEPRLREVVAEAAARMRPVAEEGPAPAGPTTVCLHGPQLVRLRALEAEKDVDQGVLDAVRRLLSAPREAAFGGRLHPDFVEALAELERAAGAAGLVGTMKGRGLDSRGGSYQSVHARVSTVPA